MSDPGRPWWWMFKRYVAVPCTLLTLLSACSGNGAIPTTLPQPGATEPSAVTTTTTGLAAPEWAGVGLLDGVWESWKDYPEELNVPEHLRQDFFTFETLCDTSSCTMRWSYTANQWQETPVSFANGTFSWGTTSDYPPPWQIDEEQCEFRVVTTYSVSVVETEIRDGVLYATSVEGGVLDDVTLLAAPDGVECDDENNGADLRMTRLRED